MSTALTKMRRLEMLRSRFKERVKQTSAEIREFYAQQEGEDSESLRRLVHRDLTELTNEGFIKVFEEENPITEVTGEIPTGKRALYVIATARENDIPGIGSLRNLAGDLVCAKNIAQGLHLEPGFVTKSHCQSIILFLDGGIITVLLDKQDLPLRLFVSRRPHSIGPSVLPELERAQLTIPTPNTPTERVRRVALLLLPINTMSAFRDHTKAGHLALDFGPQDTCVVDLNSRNKTYVEPISRVAFEKLTSITPRFSKDTSTYTFESQNWLGKNLTELAPFVKTKINSPALIQASKDFKLILS